MLSGDRGSALLLMPAAVVVVLVLAAITVDLGQVHLARREALAAAEAAANDAVTSGFDEAAYRRGEHYRLDPTRVRSAVARSTSAQSAAGRMVGAPEISIADTTVTVALAVQVDYVFARALPGGPDGTIVRATASARPIAR